MARALVALGRTPDYEAINRYESDIEKGADRVRMARHPIDKQSLDKAWLHAGYRIGALGQSRQQVFRRTKNFSFIS